MVIPTINQDIKRKVIGQGTYGCIIKPAYTKTEKIKQSSISKIGLIDETNENEVKIGEKIRKIPQYRFFFSPIIKSAPLYLHSTKQIETQDCHLVLKNEERHPSPEKPEGNKYNVHTMDYVGKYRLEEHFIELLKTKPIHYIHGHLIQCHSHLLKAFIQLKKANIIHFDLNSGNVMVSDKRQTPILIDFGLSFEANEKGISLKRSDSPFFNYSSDFNPWCIDITVISYYVQTKNELLHEITVNSKELLILVDAQLKANGNIFSKYMNEDERSSYKNNMVTYFNSWNGKSVMELYQDLYKARFTWDNYAGALLMLKLVKNMELHSPFIDSYKSLLIETLTATPNKRMDAESLKTRIDTLPRTSKLHGQKRLNMKKKANLSRKIKSIQASINDAKSQNILLAK